MPPISKQRKSCLKLNYMRRLTKIVFFLLITAASLQAQNFEAGIFLGMSNYQGDLQANHYVSTQNRIAYGVFGRYRLMDYLAVKASFYSGTISGSDAKSDEGSGRRVRNLSFRSKISEFSLQAEFNPLPFLFDESKIFSPFVFAGVAVFKHNPQAEYDEQWHDLQPLGTEGQHLEGGSAPYKLTQFSIPVGVGLEFRVTDYSNVGLEFGVRKTFTDYLDDVSTVYPDIPTLAEQDPIAAILSYRAPEYLEDSTLGNPSGAQRGTSNKDWYLFTGMTFSFNISELLSLGDGPGNYSAW